MNREDAELIKVFDWISWHENQDPRLKVIHHVANERKVSRYAGAKLKLKGVKRGIPDISCPIPASKYAGLYIELKIKPNKLTVDQLRMCKALHALGYCVRIAWSGDEAISILKKYLYTTEGNYALRV